MQDAKTVAGLSLESVVQLRGTIQLRPPGQANKAGCLLYMIAFSIQVKSGLVVVIKIVPTIISNVIFPGNWNHICKNNYYCYARQ